VQHRAEEGRQAAAATMVSRPLREEAGLIGRMRLNADAEAVWIARPRLERLLPRMAAAIDPVAKRDRSLPSSSGLSGPESSGVGQLARHDVPENGEEASVGLGRVEAIAADARQVSTVTPRCFGTRWAGFC